MSCAASERGVERSEVPAEVVAQQVRSSLNKCGRRCSYSIIASLLILTRPTTCTLLPSVREAATIDVRMGRGAPSTNHPGNKTFRVKCDGITERYMNASKHHKAYYAEKLIAECRQEGVRFLEEAPMQIVPMGWSRPREGDLGVR